VKLHKYLDCYRLSSFHNFSNNQLLFANDMYFNFLLVKSVNAVWNLFELVANPLSLFVILQEVSQDSIYLNACVKGYFGFDLFSSSAWGWEGLVLLSLNFVNCFHIVDLLDLIFKICIFNIFLNCLCMFLFLTKVSVVVFQLLNLPLIILFLIFKDFAKPILLLCDCLKWSIKLSICSLLSLF